MRVLWLNANLLLPLDKGGKLRTWHLMRHLAHRHEVTYLCFADPAEVERHGAAMAEACAHLVAVPRNEVRKGTPAFYARVARHLFDSAPYAVASYRSRGYRNAVDGLLAAGGFDRIVCDFLVPAVNLRPDLPCPAVLFTHNVEAEIWRRHAETATSPLRRLLYRSQWRRMRRFEGRALARFDRVLAVSEEDRQTFHHLYAGQLQAPTSVVPTGVDTAYFRRPAGVVTRPAHVVFVGSMDWLPNEDAVVFFCREILPIVRASVPGVTFSIVGRSPTAPVRQLAAQAGVTVTGRVEDVRPALHEAALSIVPLRIGGGTRLKIFESMAAGTPVVSTTIGAEGLAAAPGRHLLIGDTPGAFADAVILLLRDAGRRHAIAEAGRQLVVDHCDWAAVSGRFEEALTDTRALSRTALSTRRQAAGQPMSVS